MVERVVYLDVFRCLMVSAAILSHLLGYVHAWDVLGEDVTVPLRLFTRGATPGLLILFGFMVEFVYVPGAGRYGLGECVRRLLYRVMLCYLAFLTVAAAGFLGGTMSAKQFFLNLFLVQGALNANIFAIYFFVLLLTVPVLLLRLRFGVPSLLAVVAAIWLLDVFWVEPAANPFMGLAGPLRLFAHLCDFLTGLGDSWGPSILHGMTLVLFGVTLAHALAAKTLRGALPCAVAVLAALTLVLREGQTAGWATFAQNIADYGGYRAHNHEVYYAFGVLHALALMLAAWALTRVLPPAARTLLTYLGSRTFLYFLVANVILTAVPRRFSASSVPLLALLYVLLLAVTYAVMNVWERRLAGAAGMVAARGLLREAAAAAVRGARRLRARARPSSLP